jgi:hypothetical protein
MYRDSAGKFDLGPEFAEPSTFDQFVDLLRAWLKVYEGKDGLPPDPGLIRSLLNQVTECPPGVSTTDKVMLDRMRKRIEQTRKDRLRERLDELVSQVGLARVEELLKEDK